MKVAVVAVVLTVAATACTSSESSTTPATEPTTPATATSAGNEAQLAADYLNYFDASGLGDIELDRTYGGERERIPDDAEAPYPDQVRLDPSVAGAEVTLDRFSDDALLYLGYTYCLYRDVDAAPEVAIQAVVGVAARAGGREPTGPALEDLIAGVTVANYASGSLCPEYFEDTRELIDSLSS
jgi:hypothetical protein